MTPALRHDDFALILAMKGGASFVGPTNSMMPSRTNTVACGMIARQDISLPVGTGVTIVALFIIRLLANYCFAYAFALIRIKTAAHWANALMRSCFRLFVDDVVDDEDLLFAGYGGGCDFGASVRIFVGGVAVFESGGVDADVELARRGRLRRRAPTPASLTEAGLPWDAI